jgi:Encapsulating protein for peroxidase
MTGAQLKVELRGAQLADPEMGSVLSLFRRAANIIARFEDAFVFNGRRPGPHGQVEHAPGMGEEILGGKDFVGLAKLGEQFDLTEGDGDELVQAVITAITHLESKGHFGPFSLFATAQHPTRARPQVLPQDQILPFLNGGAVLRCSAIAPRQGIVVALGGEPVELVVATDMSVQFLQVTTTPSYVFRVYEKLGLRVKGKNAVARLIGKKK